MLPICKQGLAVPSSQESGVYLDSAPDAEGLLIRSLSQSKFQEDRIGIPNNCDSMIMAAAG